MNSYFEFNAKMYTGETECISPALCIRFNIEDDSITIENGYAAYDLKLNDIESWDVTKIESFDNLTD